MHAVSLVMALPGKDLDANNKFADLWSRSEGLDLNDVRDLLAGTMSEKELQLLFEEVDTSGAGRVDLQQFLDYVFEGARPSWLAASPTGVAASPQDRELPMNTPEADKASADAPQGTSPISRKSVKSSDFKVQWAEPVKLDQSITESFRQLDQSGKIIAEYVWIDNDWKEETYVAPRGLCSKSMTLDSAPRGVSDLPVWSYSGEEENDIMLVPRRIYRDPFRRGNNILVLADTHEEPTEGSGVLHGRATSYNTRASCEAVMLRAAGEDPWFGIEQEYYLLDIHTGWPLGWPTNAFPGQHDAYYLAVGANKAPGRELVESHYLACLFSGVKIGGVNSEVAPGQWEFQVGPCSGVEAADDLWMSRYILRRVCELFHVDVTFDPKPVQGWAGIGCHTNFSSAATRRKDGGLDAMKAQIEKLRPLHAEHMQCYGEGNELRLSGEDNTASMSDFSYGVGKRDASIRISSKVAAQGCGYYEDRRPAANMDPYVVTRCIAEATLLAPPPAHLPGLAAVPEAPGGRPPSGSRPPSRSFLDRNERRRPSCRSNSKPLAPGAPGAVGASPALP